jgi:hypothetical protein
VADAITRTQHHRRGPARSARRPLPADPAASSDRYAADRGQPLRRRRSQRWAFETRGGSSPVPRSRGETSRCRFRCETPPSSHGCLRPRATASSRLPRRRQTDRASGPRPVSWLRTAGPGGRREFTRPVRRPKCLSEASARWKAAARNASRLAYAESRRSGTAPPPPAGRRLSPSAPHGAPCVQELSQPRIASGASLGNSQLRSALICR